MIFWNVIKFLKIQIKIYLLKNTIKNYKIDINMKDKLKNRIV
jgi:hypothetical protein